VNESLPNDWKTDGKLFFAWIFSLAIVTCSELQQSSVWARGLEKDGPQGKALFARGRVALGGLLCLYLGVVTHRTIGSCTWDMRHRWKGPGTGRIHLAGSTLIKWFPGRPGWQPGLAIMDSVGACPDRVAMGIH